MIILVLMLFYAAHNPGWSRMALILIWLSVEVNFEPFPNLFYDLFKSRRRDFSSFKCRPTHFIW